MNTMPMAVTRDDDMPLSTAVESIPASLVLLVLSIVTTIGFCRVFDGWSFLGPMLTVVIGVHVAALAMRLLKLPGYVAIPLQVGLLVCLVAWKYYPTTLRGPFPTGQTWDFLSLDLQLAREQFPDAVAPVAAVGGFVAAAAMAVGLAALLSDAFAFRAYGRAEATVPSAVLFVFAAALGIDNHRVAVTAAWLAAALAVIAVLRASHAQSEHAWIGQRARVLMSVLPLAGLLAGCAALGGAVIGPRLPGAGEDALVDTGSRSETVEVLSPLVDIRSRLVNLKNVEMMSVASPSPHYWRATGLPIFDGQTWRVPQSDLDSVDGSFADPGNRTLETHNVRISGLKDKLLPAVFSAVSVSGGAEVNWVPSTGTLVVPDGLHRGDEFEIVSAYVDLSAAALSAATSVDPPDDLSLSLPDDFPASVAQTARDVTAGAATTYDKMITLQNWFHENFQYSLAVQKGHGDNAMVNFLRIRLGYCEQFAGTFAAMARSLGIPARVAVGYTPGELRSDGRYHVYGRNAHAWPEVWFDDIGWVSFDPTPGRGEPGSEDYTGNTPQQAGASTDSGDGTPLETTPPTLPATTVPIEGPGGATTLPDSEAIPTTLPAPKPSSSALPASQGPSGSTLLIMGIIAATIVWLVGMPRVLGSIRARHRSQRPVDVIINSWARAARTLGLIGLGPQVGETPIEHARRVEVASGAGNRTLRDLAAAATTAMYGEYGDNTTALRCMGLSEQIVRSVKAKLNPVQRVANLFDPRRVRLMMP
jgi:transglutaminase-like putative cysteine protease